ncbi:MAG: hypothetical protein ACP5UN_01970 [Candidatus Micrarchaeia archaeon]
MFTTKSYYTARSTEIYAMKIMQDLIFPLKQIEIYRGYTKQKRGMKPTSFL